MPVTIRENGQWREIPTQGNSPSIPTSMTANIVDYGPTSSSKKVYNVSYTNNLGNLIQVSATIGVDRSKLMNDPYNVSLNTASALIAGSSLRATLTLLNASTIPLANVRDNGTVNTEFLFLNAQFFVPPGLSYILDLYKSNGTSKWSDDGNGYGSVVETFTWTEVTLGIG